jgi:hypothetical protein
MIVTLFRHGAGSSRTYFANVSPGEVCLGGCGSLGRQIGCDLPALRAAFRYFQDQEGPVCTFGDRSALVGDILAVSCDGTSRARYYMVFPFGFKRVEAVEFGQPPVLC